jgi:uncharacterized protein YcfL
MKAITLFSIVLAGLACAGCREFGEKGQSAVGTVATGHMGGAYSPVNANRYDIENHEGLVLMDKHVQHSLTGTTDKQATPEGRLKAVANLRNRINRRIEVQVSCVFKSADGFSTGDETPWQTLIMTENAQETVSFVAMNNDAKKFTIRVRQTR